MKVRAAILAAILLLWATPAFSQACSMCYSTAKATSKDGQRAISKGVVVLLLPPLGFMTLGVWAAFRYGKKRDMEQAQAARPPCVPRPEPPRKTREIPYVSLSERMSRYSASPHEQSRRTACESRRGASRR
jgi:hypothetical protein